MAVFLVLGLGFWIGKFKFKGFGLGTVTSVLLVGVLIGQLDIPVSGPLKQVSFLLFLFAIGYSVGPQFFRALKGSGIKQVIFALVMCVICFLVTWAVALIFHYNVGEAVGLFAGAQTMSAVIGVGSDTINSLSASVQDKTDWINIIPVCYAVTYIFGTIGSAWILGTFGPMMLGGLKKVRLETAALEKEMDDADASGGDPATVDALRGVVYRSYIADGTFFTQPRTVGQVQDMLSGEGRREFVVRIKNDSGVLDDINEKTVIKPGDEIVLSARREFAVGAIPSVGVETDNEKLLSFPVQRLPLLVTKKEVDGMTVGDLRKADFMDGVIINSISNGSHKLPVIASTKIQRGDIVELQGEPGDVRRAAATMGIVDRPTNATDMVFVGLGIFISALIGALTLRLGGIPISLSTSGGALIGGLVLGWMRSRHPSYGRIPSASLWVLNNVGLNLFIAVVGIASGPSFVAGISQVGWMLFAAGALATAIPLIIGVWMGKVIFKFPAAVNLGCVAGSRATTAALGAIQDSIHSTIPAMGYTITYAIGNTVLILMGVLITLLM